MRRFLRAPTNSKTSSSLTPLSLPPSPSSPPKHVKDIVQFRKSFLRRLRASRVGDRPRWQRFVLIRLGAREARSMSPRLAAGGMLLLDRHYNALTPYRKGEFNMYGVLENGTCAVRYVEVAGNHLIFCPRNQAIEVVTIADGESASDYLVGKVYLWEWKSSRFL